MPPSNSISVAVQTWSARQPESQQQTGWHQRFSLAGAAVARSARLRKEVMVARIDFIFDDFGQG